MALDIVEIALGSMTDSVDFEKLATEIVRDEGYPNVRPLGGVADEGVDAQQDRFYESEGRRSKTVFQYTLKEYLTGKLDDTVAKLDKNRVGYAELVIVTPRKLSSERQIALVRNARKKHDIQLVVFERGTLATRLANFANGIFHRHFPDIRKQVEQLYAARPKLVLERAGVEEALLRASLAFTVNPAADKARRSIVSHLVLGVLLDRHPGALQPHEIVKQCALISGGARLSEDAVTAALKALSGDLVARKGDHFSATDAALRQAAGTMVVAAEEQRSVVLDIVDRVEEAWEGSLSREEKNLLDRNAQDALAAAFRYAGTILSGRLLLPAPLVPAVDRTPTDISAISDIARTQLSPALGDLLTATLGDVLYNPTPPQAAALKAWALAYVGSAVMSLDPALTELQRARFAKKTFVLDTDVLLDCIVEERPISSVVSGLVKRLVDMGAKVVVPEACIAEGVLHASIAPRTYNFFGTELLALSEAVAQERVWNVFVHGYYCGHRRGLVSPGVLFGSYLKNYYDAEAELVFFTEVVKTRLPEGVEIVEHRDVSPALQGYAGPLAQGIIANLTQAKKSSYRSEDDVRHLADTDAALFLATLSLNQTGTAVSHILGGNAYLVTSSLKYLSAARRVGLTDEVTARPESLLALLDLVGEGTIDPGMFVRLLQNPFLLAAVEKSWDEVRVLVQCGIDLRDSSLARLRRDLERGLHARVAALHDPANAGADAQATAIVRLVEEARASGYEVSKPTRILAEGMAAQAAQLKAQERSMSELQTKLGEVTKAAQTFGKKKQRQLERLAKKKPK